MRVRPTDPCRAPWPPYGLGATRHPPDRLSDHFALSRITLTEYGGKSCTNFGPAASTATRRGAAFSGSASVLTSPGWPDRTSAVAPFSTSLTPCRLIASFWTLGDVLTTFRMTS